MVAMAINVLCFSLAWIVTLRDTSIWSHLGDRQFCHRHPGADQEGRLGVIVLLLALIALLTTLLGGGTFHFPSVGK